MIKIKKRLGGYKYLVLILILITSVIQPNAIRTNAASLDSVTVTLLPQTDDEIIQQMRIEVKLSSAIVLESIGDWLYIDLELTSDGTEDFDMSTFDGSATITASDTDGHTLTVDSFVGNITSGTAADTIRIGHQADGANETYTAGDTITITIDGTASTSLPTNPDIAASISFPAKVQVADGASEANTAGAGQITDINIPIMMAVAASATVNDILSVTIATVNSGSCGTRTGTFDTTTTPSDTAIQWADGGSLTVGTKYRLCQSITVATNSSQGYIASILGQDTFNNTAGDEISMLTHGVTTSTSCDPSVIDGSTQCTNGVNTITWPTLTVDHDNSLTFGHYAYGTDDTDVFTDNTNGYSAFGQGKQGAIAEESGATAGETDYVEYALQISGLQAPGTYTQDILYTVHPRY